MKNELFFTVMPQISLARDSFGKVGEFLTLTPLKDMATEFDEKQAHSYALIFTHRVQYLTGENVKGYDEVERIPTRPGFFILKVNQNVA
jgi:hypothetical protein